MEQQQNQHQIEQILSTALANIKTVADTETVVGKPVEIGEGVTVVPVSKMTFGFLAGGGEYGDTKKNADPSFAGGSGGTVTITPVGFLISKAGTVRVAPMSGVPASADSGNKWFGLAGDIIAKLAQKKEPRNRGGQ